MGLKTLLLANATVDFIKDLEKNDITRKWADRAKELIKDTYNGNDIKVSEALVTHFFLPLCGILMEDDKAKLVQITEAFQHSLRSPS